MSEFKDKNAQDLTKTLKEKRAALHDFTFNILGGKEKNVKKARGIRKDIARILTEMTSQKAKNV